MSFHFNCRLLFVLICFYSGIDKAYSQNIPGGIATPICDGQSISTGAPEDSGFGNIYPCGGLTGSPLSPFIDFYRVVINSGNTFVFVVTPNGEVDYDFGAWKNPNWEDLGLTPPADKRGSQNDPTLTGIYKIGLSLTDEALCENPGSTGEPEPGMVKYFDVEPGDEILIAIDRWSLTDLGYTIDFGGDAVLDCTILGNNFFKCIDEEVNTADFEEEDILPELEDDFPNGFFEFYMNEGDAENNSGTPITFPFSVDYNDGEPTEVFVRVEDAEGELINIVQINLYLSKYPQLITDTLELEPVCDNGEGIATIDLTQYDELLVDTENEDIEIRYYFDEDAYQTGDFIENTTSFEVEDNQTIIADAVNVFSGCVSKDFATLKVNLEEKPSLDLSEYDGAVICKFTEEVFDEELTSIEIETGLSETDYNFTWFYEGETLTESGANLIVDAGGNYSVSVTNKNGIGCEQTVSFTIYEQAAPQFEIKSTRPAFTTGNGIMVYNISGIGVYVFKVDNGNWQSPNANGTLEFENINPGPHLVYGKDIGGCGELVLPITILGYPDFFTPNQDDINDTWNVIGLENQSDAIISIFDRYGKLLTQIKPTREGWDGTFHGKNMPSNEYWFKIEFKETLVDEEGLEIRQPTVYSGHFTLKR